MKKLNLLLTLAFFCCTFAAFAQPGDDMPINREPGKCYAKCLIADEYETVTEQVQTRAASSRVETIPAEYETVTEQVLAKAAASRIERIPAKYTTQTMEYVKGCPNGYAPEGGNLVAGGNCVKEYPVAAVYETVTEQVLVKEASTRLETVPAVYESVTEQVEVKPASYRTETIPAEYEQVTEQVLVKEASSRIERVPAKYTTETETIEVTPASTKWVKKKADRNCLSADPNDCLVWCLVEVPAQYRTVTKQVRVGCADGYTDSGDDCIRTVEIPEEYSTRTFRTLKNAATTRQIEVPAEYKTISKKAIKAPATTRSVDIPAEYTTRTYKKLVTPATVRMEKKPVLMASYTTRVREGCPDGYIEDASANGGAGDCIRTVDIPAEYSTVSKRMVKNAAATRSIDIPAEFTTVTKRNLVKKGGFTEWREVLCGDKVSPYTVRQIQEALNSRGYSPGPIDDVMGSQTKAALTKFQKDNNLPVGQLDMKTLKALGIRF